jgi:hypothetical protein
VPTPRRARKDAAHRDPRAPARTVVLFIRQFPEDLVREVRALAGLRGSSVREIVVEALRAYLSRASDWRR